MSDTNPRVIITSDESLSAVVERVRAAAVGGRVVDLVVPIDSALLLTARELRTLKEIIDEERLAVLLCTSDPLRLQLAERLGIPARALPRSRIAAAVVAAPSGPPPGMPASPSTDNGDWPGTTAVAGPVLRPDPDVHWPRQNEIAELSAETENDAEPDIDSANGAAPQLDNPPRRWLPVAAALLVLVAAAFFAIRFLVPQATVRIVPRAAPVTVAVLFDVAADGQPFDDGAAFALASQERQVEVVWEGSVPATGVRVEPDGTASSAIELRNATTEPLVIEKGTTVDTETGVEFTFSEAITVPAADGATGEPGAATGRVQAAAPGSGGNVGTGELGGRLANGVYYSNRMAPAAGGTDKEFPVVAEADLETLNAKAREQAPALTAAAVIEAETGEAILPATVSVTQQRDEFDRQVGEEADSVALRATMTIDVLTYDGDVARERYTERLASDLSREAPAGFAIGPEDIVFDDPVAITESDSGARLEVTARAEAEAVLDESERAALADSLAGVDAEQAKAILRESTDIADYTIDYQPTWLAAQMPNNAARIQFEIAE